MSSILVRLPREQGKGMTVTATAIQEQQLGPCQTWRDALDGRRLAETTGLMLTRPCHEAAASMWA